jgi:hypothetical protein
MPTNRLVPESIQLTVSKVPIAPQIKDTITFVGPAHRNL